MVKETWKPVVGFKDYIVSNTGRVVKLSYVDRKGTIKPRRELHTRKNNRGYVQIHLHQDGITHEKLLHRIVAEAFIPNPNNYPQVNHKDENKDNNYSDNLEWCTNMYNRHYGTGIERMARNRDYKVIADKHALKMSCGVVKKFDMSRNLLKTWRSAGAAAKEEHCSSMGILACCRKQKEKFRGFYWEFGSKEDYKQFQ